MSTRVKEFFRKHRPMANAATQGSRIFPDTVLSAAFVESGGGRSQLSSKYNNYFGVKAGSNWKGAVVRLNTREVINGKQVMMLEPFRVYDSPEASFRDYVRLVSSPRYVRAGVTRAATPAAQIAAIKKGGYATDPNYVEVLTRILRASGAAAGALGVIAAIVIAYTLINH